MEIVVVEVAWETLGAMIWGVVGAGVSPLSGDGLDEAFGFAVGLGPIGFGEAMLEAQLETGLGEKFGAIRRTAIREEGLDGDAVSAVKSQRLLEGGQDWGDFFVREKGGKSDSRMIIDGDVKRLDARAWVAVGTVAGSANAGLGEAAKLFNIKM
jgi:hypothetical protein